MSADEVTDLREKVTSVMVAIARMEERQIAIQGVMEKSQSAIGEYHSRIGALERESHTLKTKIWLIATVAGCFISVAWELIKVRFFGRGL